MHAAIGHTPSDYGNIQMSKLLIGLAALLWASIAQCEALSSQSAPEGYTKICSYNETCMLTKSNLVAFGSQGHFVYKIISGSFICNERSFNRIPNDKTSASCAIKTTAKSKSAATLAPTKNELPDGLYAFVSRHSGKFMAATKDGELRQAPLMHFAQYYFKVRKNKEGYYSVEAISDKKATYISVKNWQTSDGAELAMAEQTDSWNQQWQITATDDGYYSIASRFNGKAIDLLGMNTHDSAELRLWTYWGGKNQQWRLIPIDSENDHSGVLAF